jgi:hypothetical protein
MIRAMLKASNMPTCPPLLLFIGSTPSLAVKKKKRLLETMLSLSHNPNSLLVFFCDYVILLDGWQCTLIYVRDVQ